MSIWTCLRRGARFTVRPQNLVMLALLLTVQGLAAFVVVSAVEPTLFESLQSRSVERLEQGFSSVPSWSWRSLRNREWSSAEAAFGLGIGLYLLITTFHSAGILTVMRSVDGRFHFPRYFSGGGVYFLRFVRLLGILFFSFYVINWLDAVTLAPLLERYRGETRHERLAFYAGLGRDAVQVLVVVFLLLTVEYARIRTVVLDQGSMVLVWLRSLWFVLRHPLRTFGLYGVTTALDLGLVLGFALVLSREVKEEPWSWAIPLGLTLALFYFRNGVRVLRLAAEASLFLEAEKLRGKRLSGGDQLDEFRLPDLASKPRSEEGGDAVVAFSSAGGAEGARQEARRSGASVPGVSGTGDSGTTVPDLEGADLSDSDWRRGPFPPVIPSRPKGSEDRGRRDSPTSAAETREGGANGEEPGIPPDRKDRSEGRHDASSEPESQAGSNPVTSEPPEIRDESESIPWALEEDEASEGDEKKERGSDSEPDPS